MASIIKSSDDARGGNTAVCRDAVPYEFGELSGAGDALAAARRDADEIRRRAEEQGRAAALAAAEDVLNEKVHDRLATLAPALDEAVRQIQAAKNEWLAHWERTALGVATAIAERVIRRQLDRAPDITLALVREALEMAAGSGDVQLRLHPHDFETLGPHVKRLTKDLSRLGKVEVVPDPSITKGGCRVDTRFGTIDQQLESQLRRIEQELS